VNPKLGIWLNTRVSIQHSSGSVGGEIIDNKSTTNSLICKATSGKASVADVGVVVLNVNDEIVQERVVERSKLCSIYRLVNTTISS